METSGLRGIGDFAVGLTPEWHAMPLAGDGAAWSSELAGSLTDDETARASLAAELALAHDRIAGLEDRLMTAAVWVPYPETGRAGAAMVFELTPRSLAGDPDAFERFLADAASRNEGEQNYYSVQTWRSEVPAGELVGSYNLIAHETGDENGAVLEERTVIGVFPPGSSDFVQFVFSAENLGIFTNMVQQTQDVAATLEVQLS